MISLVDTMKLLLGDMKLKLCDKLGEEKGLCVKTKSKVGTKAIG